MLNLSSHNYRNRNSNDGNYNDIYDVDCGGDANSHTNDKNNVKEFIKNIYDNNNMILK